jgi:cell division protein FtsI (penicillin-binding protein 3)
MNNNHASQARLLGRLFENRGHPRGIRQQTMEKRRNRLLAIGVVITFAFLVIAGRLIDLTIPGKGAEPLLASASPLRPAVADRVGIVDSNGIIMATSLPTASLYADPVDVPDAGEAADKLVAVLPALNRAEMMVKLKSTARFVWIRRNLTPKQKYQVNRLGLPGFYFQRGERRVYPHGRMAAHVLGFTDTDGLGIAGIEKYFDNVLRNGKASLALSLDLRIQSLLHQELSLAMTEFKALGAAGTVLDVQTGEVLAMVSLPDFDPNVPGSGGKDGAFNRMTKGVYEMGSTFKLFTTAMALDSGKVTLNDGYDASAPIRVARYVISDFHAKNRWLSVPEILLYSSNIGAAKMALDVGTRTQKHYLDRLGLLHPAAIELPEVGAPLIPSPWRQINTLTIAYGHGIAVTPLQLASAAAALVNGGMYRPATLLKQRRDLPLKGKRVLSAETSRRMRKLMRMVVERGTGKKADAVGYMIGGKTGTAAKVADGGYRTKALISSFVGAFPINAPRYVVLALLDEPKGNAKSFFSATGGWVAAPVVKRVVQRMAPLLGLAPAAGEDALRPGNRRLAVPIGGSKAARGERFEAF